MRKKNGVLKTAHGDGEEFTRILSLIEVLGFRVALSVNEVQKGGDAIIPYRRAVDPDEHWEDGTSLLYPD